MDLVADDPFIILFANINHLAQLFLRPYSSRRIVRAAEYQHLVRRIRHLLIQILIIDPIRSILIDQRIIHDHAAVLLRLDRKRIVNRTLKNDPVSLLRQKVYQYRVRGYDSRAEEQVLRFLFPSVTLLEPAQDRVHALICVVERVAEDPFVNPLMERL